MFVFDSKLYKLFGEDEKSKARKKKGKIKTYFDQIKDPTIDNKITQSIHSDWGKLRVGISLTKNWGNVIN